MVIGTRGEDRAFVIKMFCFVNSKIKEQSVAMMNRMEPGSL